MVIRSPTVPPSASASYAAPADQLTVHDDAALDEADLLVDLRHLVPVGLLDRHSDELGVDVAFAEAILSIAISALV